MLIFTHRTLWVLTIPLLNYHKCSIVSKLSQVWCDHGSEVFLLLALTNVFAGTPVLHGPRWLIQEHSWWDIAFLKIGFQNSVLLCALWLCTSDFEERYNESHECPSQQARWMRCGGAAMAAPLFRQKKERRRAKREERREKREKKKEKEKGSYVYLL